MTIAEPVVFTHYERELGFVRAFWTADERDVRCGLCRARRCLQLVLAHPQWRAPLVVHRDRRGFS